MRTTVYTLDIDHYAPEITAITRPLLERWADKIEAELVTISTRRWPDAPPVYEKLQIHDLALARGDDRIIYLDADALVHPDFWNPHEHIPADTVAHNGRDMAGNRWRYDAYFRRDGRHIGSCNWCTLGSSLTLDLWRPLDDLTLEDAYARIFPIQSELHSVITREHLIDDYVLSRNIARFGLKFTTLTELFARLGVADHGYLWHQYTMTTAEKVAAMRTVVEKWQV